MKLKLHFVTFLFLLFAINQLKSQTYILSPPGGSVFTTCKGFVQNDLCCYDPPFCTTVYYCQGDNHFNTFFTAVGQQISNNVPPVEKNPEEFVNYDRGFSRFVAPKHHS